MTAERRTADRRVSPAIGQFAIQQAPSLYAEIDRLRQDVISARALSDEHRSAMRCALGESIYLREELLQCRSKLALAAESAAGDEELIVELVAALECVLPYMEAAEAAGLVGDEGCHWPVEIVRAAIKKVKKP